MESVLDQYRAFQVDLFKQLEQAFGPKAWSPSRDNNYVDRASCNDDLADDWEVASLPDMEFEGAYPPRDWHRVRDLVVEVGKKHGFTEITPLVDRPEGLNFFGHDLRFGGQYYFGLGKYTVLGIDTGCHRWDTLPSPTPAP